MELLKNIDCTSFAFDQTACLRSNCCGWCISDETQNNTFDPFATSDYGGSCFNINAKDFEAPPRCSGIITHLCAILLMLANILLFVVCIAIITYSYKVECDKKRRLRPINTLKKLYYVLLATFFIVSGLSIRLPVVYFCIYVSLCLTTVATIIDYYLSALNADSARRKLVWREFFVCVFFAATFFISAFIANTSSKFTAVVISYLICLLFIVFFIGQLTWIVKTLESFSTVSKSVRKESLKAFGVIVLLTCLILPLFYCIAFYKFFGVFSIALILVVFGFILPTWNNNSQEQETGLLP